MIDTEIQIKPFRPYQESNYASLRQSLDSDFNTVLQQPTGTGKSNIILQQIRNNVLLGSKTLLITPRRELVNQLSESMGCYADVAYSGVEPNLDKPVLCVTAASALKYFNLYKARNVIMDECHLNYDMQVKLQKQNCLLTGYTATPNRLDGRGLNTIYKKLITSPKISWFVDEGYLSKYSIHHHKAFDFDGKNDSLEIQAQLLHPHIQSIVEMWMEYARDTKTIVFVPTIETAYRLEDLFMENNVSAIALTSKDNDSNRKLMFSKFKKGSVKVLINVELFTAGIDVPDVETVILGRFTFSTPLFLQMIGRGFRPVPGKLFRILDLVNNNYYHGAPSVDYEWSLLGQGFKRTGNAQSLYHKCFNCGESVIHVSKVRESISINCPHCDYENFYFPVEYKAKKGTKKLTETFSIEELQKLDNEKLTEITRIMCMSNRTQRKKISMILALTGIPIILKKKALASFGLTDKAIDFYFD